MLPSDVLRRDGWCRSAWTNEQGQHCLSGAISESGLTWTVQQRMKEAAGREIKPQGKQTPAIGYAILWNDKQGRTAEEVIALLEKVEYKLGLRVLDDPIPWAAQMKEVAHVA